MSKVRLAIIGNGMVGYRFIEDLLDKSDAANFDITVSVKNRASLMTAYTFSSYFSHHTAEELSLVREGLLRETRHQSSGRRTRYHHQPSGEGDSLQRRTYRFMTS